MRIHMNKYGTSLISRKSGVIAHDEILALTNNLTSYIEFDFEGVETITNSFADQVFGMLALEFGLDYLKEKSHFLNISGFRADVIRYAINNRLSLAQVSA